GRARAPRRPAARVPVTFGRPLDGDARARRGARLPLRLEPDDRRLPPVPTADRRPRVARCAARARARGALLELPMCFELDDWVHFQFNFDPYRKGGAPPSHVLEIWRAEVDWMDEHVDGGVLTICMHPQVIGRGHRIAMLDELIGHCLAAGARFERMGDVAARLG